MREDWRIGALLDHVRSCYEALNSGDLLGFDHAGRGHTMLESKR